MIQSSKTGGLLAFLLESVHGSESDHQSHYYSSTSIEFRHHYKTCQKRSPPHTSSVRDY